VIIANRILKSLDRIDVKHFAADHHGVSVNADDIALLDPVGRGAIMFNPIHVLSG
jgi:hypothetical protein